MRGRSWTRAGGQLPRVARFMLIAIAGLLLFPSLAPAQSSHLAKGDMNRLVTLVVRDTELREVFEMLSRNEGVSIVLSDNVDGEISVSLFDVPLGEAVRALAQAGGYAVENRDGTYLIVDHDELGEAISSGSTEVRAFKIHYSDPEKVREIVEKHLSRYGAITSLEERGLIVVEDLPDFLARVERILREIDPEPKQILLEAKVLEVTLDETETLGVDWTRIVDVAGKEFNIGIRGLTSGTAPGLFFNLMNDNLNGAVEALSLAGRVRALATPRLLTLEHKEAEVIVGRRDGYRVTTTINLVTTESVEFLESGVILRFTPSVDRDGRVVLDIHPEVSTGIVKDGLPELTTTEVTTRLLVDDGEEAFIGGLIRDSTTENRRGVPLISRIPFLGLLFSRSEWENTSTETIVIVRATVRNPDRIREIDEKEIQRMGEFEPSIERHRREREDDLDLFPWKPEIGPSTEELHQSDSVTDAENDFSYQVRDRFDAPLGSTPAALAP